MGGLRKCVIGIYINLLFYVVVKSNNVIRRFEYKYSFKPPYLAQKNGLVPFWEYGGNAIASSDNVRVAPSLRSQKGAIWSRNRTNFDWFEVDLSFRVSGRGRIGADGLAFWYTEEKGDYGGNVFGSSDKWKGLAVLFDSFDNDNKHNNPYIMAIVNDGTKEFLHQEDGSSQMAGGCLRDFRNKPYPTRAKIEYFDNVLTLLFNNGLTQNEQDFEVCFRVEKVFLPKYGFFGVSAATGGLADDHDVQHFLTYSLHPAGAQHGAHGMGGPPILSAEQQKLARDYEEYQRKLDQQKADYKLQHPDDPKLKDPDAADWYEGDNERELRQIFQGQNQMYEAIKELSRKMDEVVGRQERTMSLLSHVSSPQVGGAIPIQTGHVDTIRRNEVDALFNNHNHLIAVANELRQTLLELKSKTDTIANVQGRMGTAQVQQVGGGSFTGSLDSQTMGMLMEMRDGMNFVKKNLPNSGDLPSAHMQCPNINCVSLTAVLLIVVVQLFVILGYSYYKDHKEQNSKKFY